MAVDQNGDAQFVHLRTHSAYSLQEGAVSVAKLIDLAIDDQQPALAITDTANLFGALEFSEKASAKGLQPIIGCTFETVFEVASPNTSERPRTGKQGLLASPSIVMLCASQTGYQNLIWLVSRAYTRTADGDRLVLREADFEGRTEGLICLSGGPDGPVDRLLSDGKGDEAKSVFSKLLNLFGGGLYVEIQRTRRSDRRVEEGLLDLAYAHDVPVVATNDVFFAREDDYEAHDALLCIKDGRYIVEDDRRRETKDNCFLSQAQMAERFSDLPEALSNTLEIARRCHFRPRTHDPILPRFTAIGKGDEAQNAMSDEDGLAQEAAELVRQARAGLDARLKQHGMADGLKREDYDSRLEYELGIIERMQFPGYFLIVADFIKWAKNEGIAVGPGRGSGAGSLVAWSLTITDLDPMRFSLLFERFLNPERISMPDFDIDFCQERRDEVIAYVRDKYGDDQVAQIITFGSMQARVALRDVGRVMQLPYGQVDRLAKLVPNNPADPKTLKQALEEEPRLAEERDKDESVAELLATAGKLEGLLRHASTHAAGIVIGDRPLDQLVPLYRDPRSTMPVTQFNMKWVEPAGLVKFDFLGLKTLTVLERCVALVEKNGGAVDLAALPLDDKFTYEMLTRGETVGVFQLESAGMRKALIGMRPDCFEDIIALVALYRPGPMDNIPVYNACKHGEREPDTLHPKIADVLLETQGVIIYQEQVMQIAQILSGYSLGEADMLRRAMGKKIRSVMEGERKRFVEGAVERGLEKQQANSIFDTLAKFADYGFNKSHAAAYALIAYQTAWLKAHYPAEFLAASMTLDMGNTDKLAEFRREALRLKIEVVPPSINESDTAFDVRDGRIHYALCAVKGAGEGAVEHLVQVRGKQSFVSMQDFFARIDPKILKKNTLETLVNAGAFDCVLPDRARACANLEQLIADAQRQRRDLEIGQNDMFGGSSAASTTVDLIEAAPWSANELLQRELTSVGFYLSAHPLDSFADLLERKRVQNWAQFQEAAKSGVAAGRLAGTVISRSERNTRTGNRMGIITFSDATGQFEAVLFAEQLERFRPILEPGASVEMICGAEIRDEGISVRITEVKPLRHDERTQTRQMRVFVRDGDPIATLRQHLSVRGEDEVSVIVIENDGEAEIEVRLPGGFTVTKQLANAMRSMEGVVDVELV
ncbi:MAG: DNA polymerase III subunit alpha [Pseudomonadota bacterium]